MGGMKRAAWLVLALIAAGTPGCTEVPADRIAAHQAEFSSWPPDVQAKVRAGQVALGFTQEQVFIALGDPTRRSEAGVPGDVTEVWVYHRQAPRFSFGIGGGSFNGHTAVGGDVSAGGLKLGVDENGRVTFHNGLVSVVEETVR
jgi:hypothetical protein